MDSGPVVVDISSDDEADDYIYINSVEKSGSGRTKSGAARDNFDDDCMILDGDPDKPVAEDDEKRDGGESGEGSDDLCIVGQKGHVACRDFPHSRHLCANFPFNTTSHELHCKLCHCFVCDAPAPCIYWGIGASFTDHCHATDKEDRWKVNRRSFKKINTSNLHPQQLHAVKHPVMQPIQKPPHLYNRIPVPPPTPIQHFKSGSLHHFSNTNSATTYMPAIRPHQHPLCFKRQTQTPIEQSQRSHPAQRAGLSLATASHAQCKRVGAIGSVAIRPTGTRPRHTAPSPNQMLKTMPLAPQPQTATLLGSQQRHRHQPVTSLGPQERLVALPRSQSMPVQSSLHDPVTPHICLKTVAPSAEEDSVKQWQDLLAGVAAELGVSDGISKNTMASQPYAPSSQSTPFDTHIECPGDANLGMGMHAELGPATAFSNPADFDPTWLDTSLGRTCHRGSLGGDSDIATLHPSGSLDSVNTEAVSGDLHLESFVAAVGEAASVAGKEQGLLPEFDPGSFLCDIDCGWD